MTLDEIIDTGHASKHVSKVWVCADTATYDLVSYPGFYICRRAGSPLFKLYQRKSAESYDRYIIGLDTVFDCVQVLHMMTRGPV